jgi:hypothetical protein
VQAESVDADGAFHLRVAMPRERLRQTLREAGVEPAEAGL